MNLPTKAQIATYYAGIEDLRLPVDLRGWNSENPNLAEAIKQVRPTVIVEVGCYLGASIDHYLTVAKSLGLEPTVFACDLFWGNAAQAIGHIPNFGDTIKWTPPTQMMQFLANMKSRGWDGQVVPIQNFSFWCARILSTWGVRCQMLYIDGDHGRDGALADMRNFWPLLDVGGRMIGDDLGTAGVLQAVAEFGKEVGHEVRPESGQFVIDKIR